MRIRELFGDEGLHWGMTPLVLGIGVVLAAGLALPGAAFSIMPPPAAAAAAAAPEDPANEAGEEPGVEAEQAAPPAREDDPPPRPAEEEPADPDSAAGGATSPSVEEQRREIEAGWQQLLAVFESEGISVDLEKKRVMVKGAVIRDKESPRYPIEYVVVAEGGNTHEALVLIKATPSNLNAALLAVGLEPGHTVIYRKKDPPPPAEDVESGKVSAYEVIPPQGTVVYISVRYEGWEEDRCRPLEDLLLDLRTRTPLPRVGWVYVGSRFAEVLLGRDRVEKFMADMERNVVALYLTGYGNALFDVNTLDGTDDSLFDVNPDQAPPFGAPVTLIFTLAPLPAEE